MSGKPEGRDRPRSSKQRYSLFVDDYKAKQIDAKLEAEQAPKTAEPAETAAEPEPKEKRKARRRKHLREYGRWLYPHRYAVGGFFVLALISAGLEMIEPLFMRFIVDRVLLNKALDAV